MARSRNIKPGLFKNEILGEADPLYSLLFVGLWTLADKDGRLENRPKRIRAELFPYRFDVDVSTALAWLKHESFIIMYEVDGNSYIQIDKWEKHQSPHHKEIDSVLPAPSAGKIIDLPDRNQQDSHAQSMHESSTVQARFKESASTPLIPDSLNSDSLNSDSLNSDSLIPDTKGKEVKPKKPSPAKIIKPDSVEEQVWQDWLTLRKQKKAPVTATVLKGATREAEKAGVSLNEFLEIWCRRGSQGLEASWIKPDEKTKSVNYANRRDNIMAFVYGDDKREEKVIGETYESER